MQIAVGGCLAQKDQATIIKKAPYVDVVFGTHNVGSLPVLLERARIEEESQIEILESLEHFPSTLPARRLSAFSSWVSVSVGCNNTCTFCIVPTLRGIEKDRTSADILTEVKTLVDQGVIEITLLGQNVNGYRGETFEGEICTFPELLRLVAEIPGIGRLRYTTSHPLEFSDDLIQCYRDLPQMVSHLHLPVQSGSNDVLQAMKRNHTIDVYIDKIAKLRKVRPDMHLSSDFIIGFPGETDQHFAETLQFIKDLDFDHSYSFVYSKRPGTPASDLPDSTPEQVKKDRLAQVQQVIKQSSIDKTDAMLGKVERVLIEKVSDKDPNVLMGTADNTRLVTFIGDATWVGRFAEIEITEIKTLNLVYGELLNLEPDVA